MFQFPGFASQTLCVQVRDTCVTALSTDEPSRARCQVGSPIRRSTDQSLFPAPRGLSQGITSFVASCCQGIHQTPFSRLTRSRKSKASSGIRKLMLPMPGRPGQGCSLDLERRLPCPAEPDATQSPLGPRLSNVSCFRYLHDVKKCAPRGALVERTGIEPVTS